MNQAAVQETLNTIRKYEKTYQRLVDAGVEINAFEPVRDNMEDILKALLPETFELVGDFILDMDIRDIVMVDEQRNDIFEVTYSTGHYISITYKDGEVLQFDRS